MAGRVNKNKVIAAAQKCVQKGQFDKAIREYTKIVEDDPRDVRIWLKIGDIYAKKGDKKEAVDTYTKVAEFYSEQGFYLKAVAVYKQILKIDGELVEVNLCLAELYKQLGLLSDAMQQYEQVSNHFHRAGRTREALAALRQIVELDPENVASRIKLAELYSKESMRDEAVEEFAKAADFLRAENRIDDFVKVSERLVFHQPDNIGATKELAGIYLRRGDPRRALQKLQLAFKADPRDTDTLEMLGQAFEDLGQVAKTLSVLKELANVYKDNGQPNKQREVYQRILALAPQDPDALKALQGGDAAAPAPQPGPASASPPLPGPPAPAPPSPVPAPAAPPQPPPVLQESPPAQAPDPGYAAGYDRYGPESFAESYGEPSGHYDAPEHLDDDGAGFGGPVSGSVDDFAAEVHKIITEAEVYLKYGLQEKAIDHLLQVFDADPNNFDVHLKLREVYVQMGRYRDASRELFVVGQLMSETDPRQAAALLNEALELDADNREARGLLAALEGAAAPASPAEEYEVYDELDDVEAIDLDADDIVEEISIESSDLIEASELTPISSDVEGSWTDAGQPAQDYSHDTVTGADSLPSGVIEVHGETTDTLGGGTPSSEVIRLGISESRQDTETHRFAEEESTKIEDDLEEAEFFIQQNLLAEARTILQELMQRAPQNPLVQGKLAELEQLERGGAVADETSEEPLVNLAEELADEFDQLDELELPTETGLDANFSVADVFDELKRGAGPESAEEDSDTHYDLGIAYREMGLVDDAISEFKVAMRSRDKEVLCHMMIGLCYIEKDLLSEAISQFKTGLYVEGISERETIALFFELGLAYERLGDDREALYYFEKVAKKDESFRDVGNRIREIRGRVSDGRVAVDGDNGGFSKVL